MKDKQGRPTRKALALKNGALAVLKLLEILQGDTGKLNGIRCKTN